MRSLPLLLVTILAAVSTLEQGSDIQADRNLGKAHYEQGEYDLAASELTRVLASSQAQARDYFNAAMAYLQNGEDDRALAAFTTAQQMDPRRIDVDFGLGVLYKRQLRYPLALESFRKVVARDPNDPCTWFNMGAVAFSMQRFGEATEAFERVLRMGYPVAQNFYVASLFRYATLLAREGRQEEARHSFGEFESLREKTPNVALTPSALENGKYGRIEVPVPEAPRSQVPQKAPVFSPPSTMPFSDRACEGEALEPSLALGDYDRDGLLDVFVSSPCGGSRLFRHRGRGELEDVTDGVGLRGIRESFGASFVDYDNSGSSSLLVLGRAGNRLYHNREGRFEDVSATAGLSEDAASPGSSAVVFDFDNDGQLDLFLSGLGGGQVTSARGLKLYRNNGDGSFQDQSEAGLGAFTTFRPRGAIFSDFAEDGFADLLVVGEAGQALLLSNTGTGLFRSTSVSLGGGSSGELPARVEVVDFNHDGWMDVFVLDEKGYTLLANRGGRLDPLPGLPRFTPHRDRLAAAFDATGDGWMDFLLRGSDGRFVLLVGRDRERFELLPVSLPDAPGGFSVGADLDGRGELRLLVAGRDGQLRLYRANPPTPSRWVRVALEGKKTNRQGSGAVIELKSGSFYQKALFRGFPVTLYTGGVEKLDVVRVTWPNGVVQNEVGVETNRSITMTESERQTSSCPFLYIWDGEGFRFLTDVVGRAPLGEILPDGSQVSPNPDDYIRIPPGSLKDQNGRYEFQVTEELREVAYLDAARLLVVDHPVGTDVYPDEKFSAPPFESFRLYTIGEKRAPSRALNHRGEDVRKEIAEADGLYAARFEPHRVSGFAEEHALLLDPGAPGAVAPLWLFLRGWVYWPGSSSMKAVATNRAFAPHPPALQVKDRDGHWVTVIENLGLPSGIDRTLVANLSGKFLSDDRSVRIVTNFRVYWDQAFFAIPADTEPPRVHTLAPPEADLHFRGFSAPVPASDAGKPERFDYSRALVEAPWNPAPGPYTRYGDVRVLLESADDRLIVMAPGDEVTLSFDGRGLEPPAEGWRRDFILHLAGWAKDHDPNTVAFRTAEPLPHRGMKIYGAAEVDPFRLPGGPLSEYRQSYQTRRAPPLIAPLAPPLLSRPRE